MDSIEELKKKIEKNPENFKLCRKLADLYVDKENYDKAIELYKNYLEKDNKTSEAYNNLGALYYYKKEYKKAEKYLVDGYKIDPDNLNIIHNLRSIYNATGHYGASLTMAEKYAIKSKKPEVLKEIAEIYEKFGNLEKMMGVEKKYYSLKDELDNNEDNI